MLWRHWTLIKIPLPSHHASPRRDVPLHTVFGKALVLPRLDDPTAEQVAEWHATYMRELEDLFESHKAQFGYADRKLTFF